MARQEIEIDEALGAVEDALDCLDAAARDPQERRQLGMVRHLWRRFPYLHAQARQDGTAQRHLSAAQAALGRLADELNDVEGFAGLGPDVGDFLLAADWLFDNAFMDAMVQQRIIESQNRVEQAIAQCEQVRDQLPRPQAPQPRCEQRPTGCGVGELCLAWCSGSFPVASPATRIAIVQ